MINSFVKLKEMFSLKKLGAVLCIAALVAVLLGYHDFSGKPKNIVYAMEQAYKNIESISGTLTYKDEYGKDDIYTEEIDFKYKSPDKFTAVHNIDGEMYTRIYGGGDKMFITSSKVPNRVQIEKMDSDLAKQQLKWLLLTNIRDELSKNKDAIDQKEFKGEVIAGRKTDGYEIAFEYNGHKTIHRIWVDKKLNLPLKWEITYPGFETDEGKQIPDEKITTTFVKLELNPRFDDSIFNYDIKPGQEVIGYENDEEQSGK